MLSNFHFFSILLLTLSTIINQFIISEDHKNIRKYFLLTTSTLSFVLMLIAALNYEKINKNILFFYIMPNVPMEWIIDKAGIFFALCVSLMWPCTVLYSLFYTKRYETIKTFFSLMSLAIITAISAAFAGNLIALILAYEIMTISTYPLIKFSNSTKAKKAANIYIKTLLSTSMALLIPCAIYLFNIDQDIIKFTSSSTTTISSDLLKIIIVILVYGSAKCAIFPLHFWLPIAMAAPTPVSAMLHAVAVVKVGVFTIIRVIFFVVNNHISNNEPFYFLFYIAGMSIIYSSLMALRQTNLKKLLAYSTISNLSYIVMATSIGTHSALIASMLHIFAHAISKITLFFCTGIIYNQTGKSNTYEIHGIAKQLPLTMTCFAIAALSTIGIPPTIGFLGKHYLLKALTPETMVPGVIFLGIGSIANIFYMIPIVINAFRRKNINLSKNTESNTMGTAAIVTTSIIIIISAFAPIIKLLR